MNTDTVPAIVASYITCWNRLDFDCLKAHWDTDEPRPFYIAEEGDPSLSWEAIDAYWALTKQITSKLKMRITDPVIHPLTDDIVHVHYQMHYSGVFANQPAIGGDVRVSMHLRAKDDTWKIFQYVEAPFATITAVRRLLRLNADQDM